MSVLVSLWRLNHYKQAPWSSWSILYSRRRPKNRARSPMLCFDTATYEMLREQRDEQLKARQLHQHQIWQHVQDRLAEQNRILEEEKAKTGKEKKNDKISSTTVSSSGSTTTTTTTVTSTGTTSVKRSIRWGLQNNMIKKFDKNQPITLVNVPALDKKPTKSALKVRTTRTIQKSHAKPTTDTKASMNSIPVRKQAVDFF
ncbi:hypothetical protein BGZ94_000007 [Podila epigama]|nr:hypothetical protein BGZ94_000007 [Podila epigama]